MPPFYQNIKAPHRKYAKIVHLGIKFYYNAKQNPQTKAGNDRLAIPRTLFCAKADFAPSERVCVAL